jgi:integrase/recombinase XerD
VRAAIESFLDCLTVERDASPHTVAAYRRDLASLLAVLPDGAGPGEVTADHLRELLSRQRARGLAPRSVARGLAACRSLFRFLREEGWIERDPAEDLDAVRLPQPIPRVLEPAQVEALLEAPQGQGPLPLRDRALLELLYATGARASEVAGLPLRAAEDGLRERAPVVTLRVLGKGRKERLVPLGPGRPRLLQRRKQGGQAVTLLLSRSGRAISRVDVFRVVRRCLTLAGLPADCASPSDAPPGTRPPG